MAKVQKNYRLSEEVLEMLTVIQKDMQRISDMVSDEFEKKYGYRSDDTVTETGAITRLIIREYERLQNKK